MTAENTATAAQMQKKPWQDLANRMTRGVLRAPLLSRLAGKRLVTLYVVGRKSGKRYAIPVAYVEIEGAMLIGSSFAWGRNLRTGEPLAIRLRGKRREADVQVFAGEAEVTGAYAAMCRVNRVFANFNQVGYDAAGNPDPADLRRAWLDGARAFRLTPR
jgi:deazaflavin-dependent oxidoreductase (nitroreductase family)